jgi:hypothetical protein
MVTPNGSLILSMSMASKSEFRWRNPVSDKQMSDASAGPLCGLAGHYNSRPIRGRATRLPSRSSRCRNSGVSAISSALRVTSSAIT